MQHNAVHTELRLILGDQLNELHTWFKQPREDILYVMMEIRPESLCVVHHIRKITGFFLAMRTFADKLRQKGFHVRYYRITDPDGAPACRRWVRRKQTLCFKCSLYQ